MIWLLGRNAGGDEPRHMSVGLLILRVSVGLMMAFGHGLGKLASYSEQAAQFPDPYGLGPGLSMGLSVFAEFFCSLALIFGAFTRAAVVPLMVTMLTAVFIIHADDPWGTKELAVMYLVPYVTILVAGPGRYSLDRLLWWRWTDRRSR
jgi:putative oxidoreductase